MKGILVLGVFLGLAAGNVWSAPFIGGDSIVGVAFVLACLFFSALPDAGNRFFRTGAVAALAWPIAHAWQTLHHQTPGFALALLQAVVLLVGSQASALLASVVAKRMETNHDR